MKVWVIENVDWPGDRYVHGVAASVAAASAFIQSRYGKPYIIKWSDPVRISKDDDPDEEWRLTGSFTAVPGYCGNGDQSWDFRAYELIDGEGLDR